LPPSKAISAMKTKKSCMGFWCSII